MNRGLVMPSQRQQPEDRPATAIGRLHIQTKPCFGVGDGATRKNGGTRQTAAQAASLTMSAAAEL